MQAFYLARDGVQYGPFEEARFRELIAEQRLVGTDLVWFPKLKTWQPAAEALAAWFPSAIPTPPPLPPCTAPAAPRRPSEPLPFAKLRSGHLPNPTTPRPAAAPVNAPAKPWMKHVESTKGLIGTDKPIDPRNLAETFTKTFLSREPHGEEVDDPYPDDGYAGPEDGELGYDDDEDDGDSDSR